MITFSSKLIGKSYSFVITKTLKSDKSCYWKQTLIVCWRQRVGYWLDSPLLLWTDTLKRLSFCICSSERKKNWQSSSGEGRKGKGNKTERATGLVLAKRHSTVTITDIKSSIFQRVQAIWVLRDLMFSYTINERCQDHRFDFELKMWG